jgi:hypothetical protein
MAIYKSLILWGLFEYTKFLWHPREKNRAEKDPEILEAKWL